MIFLTHFNYKNAYTLKIKQLFFMIFNVVIVIIVDNNKYNDSP
jgi:hypothetical protein